MFLGCCISYIYIYIYILYCFSIDLLLFKFLPEDYGCSFLGMLLVAVIMVLMVSFLVTCTRPSEVTKYILLFQVCVKSFSNMHVCCSFCWYNRMETDTSSEVCFLFKLALFGLFSWFWRPPFYPFPLYGVCLQHYIVTRVTNWLVYWKLLFWISHIGYWTLVVVNWLLVW